MINKKNILNLILLCSVSLAPDFMFSMEADVKAKEENQTYTDFPRIFNPRRLKEQAALYIAHQDINTDNIPEELHEYTENIKAIELRDLPERGRELFLSIADEHSHQMVKESLEIIDDLDLYLSKEESDFIKKIISEHNQFEFRLNPFLVIARNIQPLWPNFFNEKYKNKIIDMKNNFVEQLKLKPDDLNFKIVLYFIDSLIQADPMLSKDSEFQSSLESSNDICHNQLYIRLRSIDIVQQAGEDFNLEKLDGVKKKYSDLYIILKKFIAENPEIMGIAGPVLFTCYIGLDCCDNVEFSNYSKSYYEKILKDKDNRFNFYLDYFPTLLHRIKKDNSTSDAILKECLKQDCFTLLVLLSSSLIPSEEVALNIQNKRMKTMLLAISIANKKLSE